MGLQGEAVAGLGAAIFPGAVAGLDAETVATRRDVGVVGGAALTGLDPLAVVAVEMSVKTTTRLRRRTLDRNQRKACSYWGSTITGSRAMVFSMIIWSCSGVLFGGTKEITRSAKARTPTWSPPERAAWLSWTVASMA